MAVAVTDNLKGTRMPTIEELGSKSTVKISGSRRNSDKDSWSKSTPLTGLSFMSWFNQRDYKRDSGKSAGNLYKEISRLQPVSDLLTSNGDEVDE